MSRFVTALQYYTKELAFIKSSQNHYDKDSHSHSQIRYNLGDMLGRVIRFYLRRFFNPLPVSLHTASNSEQPDYDFSRSGVHQIIEMVESEGQLGTVVADGSISSVISFALIRIKDFFELNSFIDSSSSKEQYMAPICDRPASKQGLKRQGSTIILNDDDLNEILLDISESHVILSGIRACKFFHTVMTWPGVPQTIDNVGGWSKVEYYSKMFSECKLEKEFPDETYFQLLSNVNELIQRIDNNLGHLCELEEKCHNCLKRLWTRFRCGTRKNEILKVNPGIQVIREHLKAGGAMHYPSITSVED